MKRVRVKLTKVFIISGIISMFGCYSPDGGEGGGSSTNSPGNMGLVYAGNSAKIGSLSLIAGCLSIYLTDREMLLTITPKSQDGQLIPVPSKGNAEIGSLALLEPFKLGELKSADLIVGANCDGSLMFEDGVTTMQWTPPLEVLSEPPPVPGENQRTGLIQLTFVPDFNDASQNISENMVIKNPKVELDISAVEGEPTNGKFIITNLANPDSKDTTDPK